MKINMHRAKDTGEKSCETDAERIVQKYLDSFLEQHDDSINDSMEQTFNRVVCCETSSSLYCNKCCNLLVPDGSLPEPISLRRSTTQQHDNNHSKEGRRLQLPFNLHIVLDDRRGSATGLHAKVLLNNGMGKDQVDSTISNEMYKLNHIPFINFMSFLFIFLFLFLFELNKYLYLGGSGHWALNYIWYSKFNKNSFSHYLTP